MNRNLLYVIIAVVVIGGLALILMPSRQTPKTDSPADHVHDVRPVQKREYQQ